MALIQRKWKKRCFMSRQPKRDLLYRRDLGSLFPQILSNAGLHVEKHDDHFPDRKTPDASWLSEVGRNGWFALSRDKRIRYRPNEQEATMRLASVFLSS